MGGGGDEADGIEIELGWREAVGCTPEGISSAEREASAELKSVGVGGERVGGEVGAVGAGEEAERVDGAAPDKDLGVRAVAMNGESVTGAQSIWKPAVS